MLMVDMIIATATTSIHTIHAGGVLAWVFGFLYLPEVLYTLILLWLFSLGRVDTASMASSRGPDSSASSVSATGL
jgi:hypothetical protein